MLVKTLQDVIAAGGQKTVSHGKASTTRLLTAADGMGFSMSDVRLGAGTASDLWYKHHWEANYILTGTGQVSDKETGNAWPLAPGTMYVVGPKDRHCMRADTDLNLLSVFNPPLRGDEQHDSDGSLIPSGALPPGPPGA